MSLSSLRSPSHFAPPDRRGSNDGTGDAATLSKSLGRAPGLTACFGKRTQPTEKADVHLLNHLLRILFRVAIFGLRAFLLHLSKGLCHVFDMIPDIAAYINWRGLLRRHRDTVAWP